MPIGTDRVQPYVNENDDGGGDDNDSLGLVGPVPLDPSEDAIESAGHYFQDASNQDELVYICRDGNDLCFRDVSVGTEVSLSTLNAGGGGGISEAQHKALRALIHFIDSGPADGFASGAFREITYTGIIFPASIIWYESAAKMQKIVELNITYTGILPTTEQWLMYDTDGTTVLATVTDTVVYSGVFEQSRTRTVV